ncbi:MAG TPA: hypothetical protein VFG84_12665 [Gemmatimonadaceae bacterium]|nr:hypothetical protein [Gemmatimonadaceae bacterium]
MTLDRMQKLGAMGALGVGAGVIALYVLVAWISRSTAIGGMDATQAAVTWYSLAVPVIAIVAVHVVYARVLWRESSRSE